METEGGRCQKTMPSVMKAKDKKLRASQVSRRTQVSDSRGEPGRPGLWGEQGVPTAGAGVAKQEKYPKPTVAVAVRPCERPKNHRIAHSTWVNCPVSECSLSKAVAKKKGGGRNVSSLGLKSSQEMKIHDNYKYLQKVTTLENIGEESN